MTTPVARPVPHLEKLNQGATLRRLSAALQGRPDGVADPFELRMGVIVSPLIDVSSYNVQLTSDGITRTMPSAAGYAPVVGDPVWVAQLGPSYLILGMRAGPYRQQGSAAAVFTAAARISVVVTWPVQFTAAPVVLHSVLIGSNFDVLSNAQAISATQATFTLWRPAGTNITGTGALHWQAIGA